MSPKDMEEVAMQKEREKQNEAEKKRLRAPQPSSAETKASFVLRNQMERIF